MNALERNILVKCVVLSLENSFLVIEKIYSSKVHDSFTKVTFKVIYVIIHRKEVISVACRFFFFLNMYLIASFLVFKI